MEIINAKAPAQIYYARHMQQGVTKYDEEMVLVTENAIKLMMPSFNGKPVYVFHVDEIDLENAHGYVTDTFYNELDGWVWSKIIIIDEVAIDAVNKGWAVSNAYIPTEYLRGGTHHNVEYDRKILNGDYTHLAIVPNPRYEDACIMSVDEYKAYCVSKKAQLDELQNSKTVEKKGSFVMKFFKTEKKEVSSIDDSTMVELQNDNGVTVEVSIEEMRQALLNAKKNEAEKEEEKINMDSEIFVGDEKMTVKELINRYQKMNKKNSDDEEKSNEDDEKENSEDEKEKENEENDEEKKNAHFTELKNANKVKAKKAPYYMSHADRLAVGKAKY